ncbi:hypothetical protein, partial [Paenibacillus odorifer]
MHVRRIKVAAVLLSTAVLSQSAAYGAHAASAGTTSPKVATTATVSALDKLGSIALKTNISAKLTDVSL